MPSEKFQWGLAFVIFKGFWYFLNKTTKTHIPLKQAEGKVGAKEEKILFPPHHQIFELFQHCRALWACLFSWGGLGQLSVEANIRSAWGWKVRTGLNHVPPFPFFHLLNTLLRKVSSIFKKITSKVLWKRTAVNFGFEVPHNFYMYMFEQKKTMCSRH